MKQDSKDRLLQAATALFAEKGYDSVSLREITAAAGVNISMISYYFGNKKGLYDAALADQLNELSTLLSMDAEATDPRTLIRTYANLALRIHEKNPYLLQYVFRTLLSPSPEQTGRFEEMISRLYDLLARALTRGVQEGLFRGDLDVPSAVLLLAGAVNFHYIATPLRNRIVAEKRILPDECTYVSHAVEVFLRGIESRRSERRKDRPARAQGLCLDS